MIGEQGLRRRAASDLDAARLAVDDGDPARAGRLLRGCADAVRRTIPEAVPDWQWIAGRCAARDPAFGDPAALLRSSRDGFRAQGRPGDAALVCTDLAELAPTPEEAVEHWARAADLFAEEPHECDEEGDVTDLPAFRCAVRASSVAVGATQRMDEGDAPRAATLLHAAHALSRRHGPDDVTAHLGALAAFFGAVRGDPADAAVDAFATARRLLGPPDPGNRLELARIDLLEARTLVVAYRLPEAEARLHAALPVLREHGSPDEVEGAESMLVSLRSVEDLTTPGAARSRPTDAREWASPELRAGGLMVRALTALGSGSAAEAESLLRDAADAAGGAPLRALVFEAFAAAVRLLSVRDVRAAARTLERVERALGPDDGRSLAVDDAVRLLVGRTMLRAGVAATLGDRSAGPAHLGDLESALAERGAGLLAARIALDRARLLLENGDDEEALAVALPAALAVDSVRFAMPDAGRRQRWAAAASRGFETAFRAAVAGRRTRTVAELIEVVRGHAVPVPLPTPDDGGPGDIAWSLAEIVADGDLPGTGLSGGAAPGGALSGPAVLAGDVGRTGLGLPARLRTPWGDEALAGELLRAARYRRPLRGPETTGWLVPDHGPGAPGTAP